MAYTPNDAYIIFGVPLLGQLSDAIQIYEQLRAVAVREAGGDEEKRALLHIAFICLQEVGPLASNAGTQELMCRNVDSVGEAQADKIYTLVVHHDRDLAPIPILDFLAALQDDSAEIASAFGRNVAQKLRE